MKVAILGCRGIPARYGGFETLAEQLSLRLAKRGHEVTVYCRRRYSKETVSRQGVRQVFVPALYTKHLETLSHTFCAVLHQCAQAGGAVLLLNNANAPFILILRLFKKQVFVHVDGLEWKRKKWGRLARGWHRLSEKLAVWWANDLISDSMVIAEYYAKTHGRKPHYVAYGCNPETPDVAPLTKYGLEPGNYLLFVGRMEPENHPDRLIQAYTKMDSPMPLVMAGWAPYAESYMRDLQKMSDKRIRFLGGVYGRDYWSLLYNCRAFLHASSVGGTHPVLVEALGAGRPVLSSDIPENRETAEDTALFFSLDTDRGADQLRWLLEHPTQAEALGVKARDRAIQRYDWDAVAGRYESIFAARGMG